MREGFNFDLSQKKPNYLHLSHCISKDLFSLFETTTDSTFLGSTIKAFAVSFNHGTALH